MAGKYVLPAVMTLGVLALSHDGGARAPFTFPWRVLLCRIYPAFVGYVHREMHWLLE